ncbi:Petrobactin biosynthesis protein AsbA [Fictibacillus phosphorivorans]|uniref:Petrobactin biosynthesis protein AsbA n=1 Tax=Fictibacillus phosphorivorans TaxID=1221500 RepID=A0A163PS60_9BACL|nr:DUF4865 family protein [Fictibacillus phosphorivorans]KZE64043.1 Petrobactin biosynthesis protein AsbA [Fictibacillus phosphorivorans]
MLATQYKITLPSDYDMNIIRERVKNNGYKTDGFEDLKFKLYLITEKGIHYNMQNSYCPLYLWKGSEGLNKFLFTGFYDNIIQSFGWQRVNVGIPLVDTTTSKITDYKYMFQLTREILPQESLKYVKDTIQAEVPSIDQVEHVIIYNPDQWKYEINYFLNDVSGIKEMKGTLYSILHVSEGNPSA